jgi:hypothetical protein
MKVPAVDADRIFARWQFQAIKSGISEFGVLLDSEIAGYFSILPRRLRFSPAM